MQIEPSIKEMQKKIHAALEPDKELHDILHIGGELPAVFPINPWREGWYGVIWQERTI